MVFIPDTDGGEAAAAAAAVAEKRTKPGFMPDVADDQRPLAYRPDQTDVEGIKKNAATGAIKGATWIAGQPGDLSQLGDVASAGISSLVGDKTTAENLKEIDAKREGISKQVRETLDKHLPSWLAGPAATALLYSPTTSPLMGSPARAAPTSEAIGKEIFKTTGEYTPQTKLGEIGQIGTAGAVSMLSPGGWKKAAEELVSKGAGAGARAAVAPLTQMGMGAASAIAGEEAGKYAGPVAGVGASLLAPTALSVGTKSILGNTTKSAQRAGAGKILKGAATDPEAVARAHIGDSVGPQMLADIAHDPGIARAEAIAAKIGGQGANDMIHGAKDQQNIARRGLVASLANPDGDYSVVGSSVERHADALQATHDAQVAAVQRAAEQAAKNAHPGANIEDISRRMNERVHALGRELSAGISKLYKAIDPEGKMFVPVTGVREHGLSIVNGPPKVETNMATPYIKAASEFPEVMPFSHLWDFDKQLSGAMAKATKAGDETGLNELRDLKGVVKKTIRSVPEDIHSWQGEQVRAGKMSPDDTLAAALERQHERFGASRAEGVGVGEVSSAVSEHGAETGVRGVSGKRGELPGGEGRPPGDPGMEGAPVPGWLGQQLMDTETAARLGEANKAWGAHAQTFKEGPVGEALKRGTFRDAETGEVRFKNELGATNAFVPGDKGALNVKAWLAADSSPEAIQDLKTLAAQRIREDALKDGVIDPRKLESAKAKYHNALRELEDVSPGFMKTFDDAATATEAISLAEKARAAAMAETGKAKATKLIGIESADDLGAKMGEFIKAKDAYRQVNDLMGKVEHDPAALESVRGATANWVINNLDLALKDSKSQPIMSSAKVEDLIRTKADALHRIFGDKGFDNLVKLQETFAKEQAKTNLQRAAQGSDTAMYLEPLYKKLQQHQASAAMQGLNRLTEMGTFALMWGGNWEHAILAGIGRAALGTAEHFIQKARARGITSTMDLVHHGLTDAKFGQELMRESIETARGEKLSPLQIVLRSRTALGAQQETQSNIERFGRAEGGAVKIDHAAEAARLIKAVDTVRKQQAQATEPLLKLPDETITRGLAAAGKDI